MDELKPLTEEEIIKLRKILQQDDRVEWFWATARKFAAWFFGAMAVIVAFRADLRELLSWAKGP